MKKRILGISLSIAFAVSVAFSVVNFQSDCNNLRNDVLRLHILANSDSEADQSIKLAVRDELLRCGKSIFSGKTDVKNAEYILNEEKDALIEIADSVLKENGFNYKTQIAFTEEYFTTRSYGEYTLPAGRYRAIKVILGEGEGHNWWCVMFPPLCLPAATSKSNVDIYFDKKERDIITSDPEYEIRFRLIEIIENIKNKIVSN